MTCCSDLLSNMTSFCTSGACLHHLVVHLSLLPVIRMKDNALSLLLLLAFELLEGTVNDKVTSAIYRLISFVVSCLVMYNYLLD